MFYCGYRTWLIHGTTRSKQRWVIWYLAVLTLKLLPEDERVYRVWHRLLFSHQVRGVQVHDAHLAAVLEVHEIAHLLTLNGQDFKRFPNVIAVHPQEVIVS